MTCVALKQMLENWCRDPCRDKSHLIPFVLILAPPARRIAQAGAMQDQLNGIKPLG
jgi:hypothetical protein